MKKSILILGYIIICLNLTAQTSIDTNITKDTTWNKNGSPYLLSSTIQIAENVTLTIEPGVVIKMQYNSILLHVYGTVMAVGSLAEPIVFTSIMDDVHGGDSNNDGDATAPAAGDWRSIWIDATSGSSSQFQYCTFLYGGRINGAVFADNSAPIVTDCEFNQCSYGFEVDGSVSPVLQNNQFTGLAKIPVVMSIGSTPLLGGNGFLNNSLTGIGLISNSYSQPGESYVLQKIGLGGNDNTPYIAEGYITVNANTTLTIDPGVIIKEYLNSNMIHVEGTLLAAGTALEPIVFTSFKDDDHGGDSNNDGNATVPAAGDWRSIRIDATSGSSSQFQYCTFLYGGRIDGVVFADNSTPVITDCEFNQCSYGFKVDGLVSPTLQDNQFTDLVKIPVVMSIGSTPLLGGNGFLNNSLTGIGLISNSYSQPGESYVLQKIGLGGNDNTPYIAEGYITVNENTTLTIDPGVIIKEYLNSNMFHVAGTLLAAGTALEPIVFTSVKDDDHGGDSNNDSNATVPAAGDWRSIRIDATSSSSSQLQYCTFLYGGRIDGVVFADNSSPVVTNCEFSQCSYGFKVDGLVSPTLQDNQFSVLAKSPLVMSIGSTPLMGGNSFLNNSLTGIGLISNSYSQPGESYLLQKIGLGGSDNTPYIAEGYITVEANTTLTIDPGVIIKKIYSTDLFLVSGTLVMEGLPDEPIVITSIEDDAYGGDSNNDGDATTPLRGEWGSIDIGASSGNSSSIQNCLLRYGGRINGAIFVNGGQPDINHNVLEYCDVGLEISYQADWSVKNHKFSFCEVGMLSRLESGLLAVDSSLFRQNIDGIHISSGLARINHSEFSQNSQFDISNTTPGEIDATKNLWDYETFLNIITGSNPKNLVNLNDQFDNPAYGIIDYSEMVIPASTVFRVAPNTGVLNLDTGTVAIKAYPVKQDSRVVLFNGVNGEWSPESVTIIDSLTISVFLDFSMATAGIYDIWIINGNDTLKKEDGFSLVEAEAAFGEWVKFEVTDKNIFNSGVILPTAERLYCLVKKATHKGYSGTWKGSVTVFGQEGILVQSDKSAYDIKMIMENVQGGYYTFELLSGSTDFWDGYIKFCYDPDTLTVNEWETGQILRPYGNDWKVFELNEDVAALTFQTEGYGKWSSINVFKDFLGNMEHHWFFNNWGKGYNIQGTIENPPRGKYYLKYEDSAVLTEDGRPRQDQSREYLVRVGTDGEQASPDREISVSKLSAGTFGQGYGTMGITGSGLSDSMEVWLISGTDTIKPAGLTYDEDSQTLFAGFDFTSVNTGNYQLMLSNEVSSYNHPGEITVEAEKWNPIGIDITGNVHYRVGRHQSIIITITNQANADIQNGYVAVEFDHDDVALNIVDDFYSPEFNAILNQALEEEPANKQLFFFSNLGPGEELELHLKMFSNVTDLSNVHLEVTSGVIDGTNYDQVMSLMFNHFIEMLKAIPFPQIVKDQIDGYTTADWEAHMDLVVDLLGLNRFNHLPDYWGSKGAEAVNNSNTQRKIARVHRATDIWTATTGAATAIGSLTGPGGKWQAGGEMAMNGESTIVPGGVGLALGGPLGLAKEGVHKLINIWARCIAALEGDETGGQSNDDKTTRELTEFVWVKSTTPEDKFGPIGASVAINDSLSNHFVDTTTLFRYRIDYWNKEDATAPAAIVYIRDTLDADFDLATFNFTEAGFMKWSASLEGGQYVNLYIDTRPDMPYIVNVEGSVDPASREVFWVHTTLDPETMELTEDPLGGYLPPIDSTGYQVGWVSYTIQSKEDLSDSATFTNQAFVNFDGVGRWGPAPKESPFTNVFDVSRPISEVVEGIALSYEDSVLISWTGSDAGSGVRDYTIFVSDGNGYSPWITYVRDTSAWFSGEAGKTYHFYSIARDRVGNREEKEAVSEYQLYFVGTGIDNLPGKGISVTIYPNPSAGIFTLENHAGNQEVIKVEVYNMLGESILSYERMEETEVLDLSMEPDGVYVLVISSSDGIISRKLVKH